MGEYAELALEQDFMNSMKCEDIFGSSQPFRLQKEQKILWTTKDGQKIDIRDMSTSHIQFSIAKCKRDEWRMDAIPYLEEELLKRGV